MINKPSKVGPGRIPVINKVITPISRVITPVTHLFSAIYRGYFTQFITDFLGPPCLSLWFVVVFFRLFYQHIHGMKLPGFPQQNCFCFFFPGLS